MAFKVNEFKGAIKNPAQAHRFEMFVYPPAGMGGYKSPYGETYKDLRYKIEATELPGRSVRAIDHSHYGPIQKVATGVQYQDFTASVIVSEDLREVRMFNHWLDLIVGDHRVREGNSSARYFDVNFFDNYKSRIQIQQFSADGMLMSFVEMLDAYPILISPVALSWASQEIIKLNVTFTYRYFIDRTNEGNVPTRRIVDQFDQVDLRRVAQGITQRDNEIINPGARSLSGLADGDAAA